MILDDGDRIVVSATAEGFDTITGSYNEELSMLSDGIFLSYSSSEPDSLMLTDTDVFHPRIATIRYMERGRVNR